MSGSITSARASAEVPRDPRAAVTGWSGAADPAWFAAPRLGAATPRRGADARFADPAADSAALDVAELPSSWLSAAATPAACGPARNNPIAKAAAPPRATRLDAFLFFLLAIIQSSRC
jgi:hypothetical protein